MKYLFQPTELFAAKIDKIRRHDPHGHERILQVIDRLLQTPADADGWMHGVYAGKLKKYVGRGDYRLVYQWCEECRKTQRKIPAHCGACGEGVSDHSVIFLDVYHKNEQDSHLRHVR